jgi:hypothetical protein
MMMSGASNPLAGKLTINGNSYQAPESSSHSPLKSGLRISVRSSTPPPEALPETTNNTAKKDIPNLNIAGSMSPDKQAENPVNNFFTEMSARLGKEAKSPESASFLAASLRDTAESIKSKFGQDKANEFMSKILSATDSKVSEKVLGSAITGFFQSLKADSNISGMDLEKMRGDLNQGLDNALDGAENGEINHSAEGMSLSGISARVAEFLRQEVGSENAAAYMESLGPNDDCLDALATACGIVANENGQEAAQKFVAFLNSEVNGYLSGSQDNVSVLSIDLGDDYSNEETRKTFGFNWGQQGTPVENPSLYEAEHPSGNNPPPDASTATLVSPDLYEKGHQGLTIKLEGRAENTGNSALILDISALYQAYLAKSPNAASHPLENPKANLVDKIA